VVLHIPVTGGRHLPGILDRAGPLRAAYPADGERLRPGRVYVAPPNQHLLVVKDTVRLSGGPRQNGFRPAADPLSRSAALHAGPRTTAVVLSGTLDDAALGCATVERRGGRVTVQDPAEAAYSSMPRSAIAATEDPIVTPVADLAGQITRLAKKKISMLFPDGAENDDDEELAAEIGGLLAGAPETNTLSRTYSRLSCPECGGPLYSAREERAQTYDCLVGHRWSPQSLVEGQSAAVERGLWLAIRSLEERGRLTTSLADVALEQGHALSSDQFSRAAEEARRSADVLREVAESMTTEITPEPDRPYASGSPPPPRV
jgi:two-component system chemotaxis response regulator CheB